MSSKLMLIASNCDGEVKMPGRVCDGKRRLCVYVVPLQRTSSSQAHLVISNEVINVRGNMHTAQLEKRIEVQTHLCILLLTKKISIWMPLMLSSRSTQG